MTVSDRYARIAPSAIIVAPTRQRGAVELDESFLASIRERGILMPLLVRGDLTLVAGGRRLAAAFALALSDVPVRFVEDACDDVTVELIELEENIRRRDLSWQDEAQAIARIHSLWKAREPSWTIEKSASALGQHVRIWLRVARALASSDEAPKLANATGMRTAWNILQRSDARAHDMVLEEISTTTEEMFERAARPRSPITTMHDDDTTMHDDDDEISATDGDSPAGIGEEAACGERSPTSPLPSSPPGASLRTRTGHVRPRSESSDVLCTDFIAWARTYEGPRFNFIHCDFPYGKRIFAGEWGGKGAEDSFKYDDEPEVYWRLCAALCESLDRLATPTAHLMFWASSEIANLHKTIEFFRAKAPSLIFQPRALTWHKSDNVGIAPDARRGPWWICETALMATRGDRPLVKSLASSYSAPTARSLHPSTKPEPVLRHFFGMFVDGTTRLLDPTCGSGSALRAAESLGAASVLGIERSSDYSAVAISALRAFRNLRELTG